MSVEFGQYEDDETLNIWLQTPLIHDEIGIVASPQLFPVFESQKVMS